MLLQKIEELRPQLTSSKVDDRLSALVEITTTLRSLAADELVEDEVNVLLDFFCARLQDNVLLLPPTLQALHFLCSCHHLPPGFVLRIATGLFKDQQIQALKQDVRQSIYELLAVLLSLDKDALKSHSDFVMTFIQAIDGERDPRNLLLIFYLHSVIAHDFDIGPFNDELFDVVACYFPIDFKPSANEVQTVTSSELQTALNQCLCARPSFATPCMRLLIEQLDEAMACTATFTLLDVAFDAFPPEVPAQWAMQLWNDVRKQSLVPKSSELEREALKCLRKLIAAASIANSKSEKVENECVPLVVLLGQIFKDVEPFLCSPEMSLLDAANRILIVAASASQTACRNLSVRTIPLLMERSQATNKEEHRVSYVGLIAEWFRFLVGDRKEAAKWSLASIGVSLVALMTSYATDRSADELRVLALSVLGSLLELERADDEALLPADAVEGLAFAAYDVLCKRPSEASVKGFLHALSGVKSELMSGFLERMMEKAESDNDTGALLSLSLCVHDSTTYERIVDNFLLKRLLQSTALSIDVIEHILNGVLEVVLTSECSNFFADLIEQLSAVAKNESDRERVVRRVGFVIQEVALRMDFEKLKSLLLRRMLVIDFAIDAELVPFSYLFAVSNQDFFDTSHIDWLIDRLFPLVTSSGSIRLTAARVFAVLYNAVLSDERLRVELDRLESVFDAWDDEAAGWITRAVLLRNFEPYASRFVRKMIMSLKSERASRAFSVLLRGDDEAAFLSERVRVRTSCLYRQRIAVQLVPVLLERFQEATQALTRNRSFLDERRYLFTAVGDLLAFARTAMPASSADLPEISKLLPLLVESVNSTDWFVVRSSLETLRPLLSASHTVEYFRAATGELETFVERLLAILELGHDVDVKLRLVAARCLYDIASAYPIGSIYMLKRRVTRRLELGLGDPKRVVRQAVGVARNRWFLCE